MHLLIVIFAHYNVVVEKDKTRMHKLIKDVTVLQIVCTVNACLSTFIILCWGMGERG